MNKITIIGAGVVGMTLAYALQRRGILVDVIDARDGAAQETSYANAGELSFGYSGPWATPGLLAKTPGMLLNPRGPLRLRPDFSSIQAFLTQLRWMYWFSLNTKESRFNRNKRRIVALSSYSKVAQQKVFSELELDFSHQKLGTLQLFREEKLFEKTMRNDLSALQEGGVRFSVANASECIAQEPALEKIAHQIAGGLIFTDDETGDCHAFTKQLACLLESRGVRFFYNTQVKSIRADSGGVRGLDTSRGHFATNHIVLACGPWTSRLAKPLRLVVPIYPVRGYSLTAPIVEASHAPISTVLDETTKIAITRLGDVVRVGGTAEISGFDAPASIKRHNLLCETLRNVFPGCAQMVSGSEIEHWEGFRPMTPDGTPIIGKTVVPGLYINAGHGTLGWTQSFGSAELCAAIIANEMPALAPEDYELARYGRTFQNSKLYSGLEVLPANRPA